MSAITRKFNDNSVNSTNSCIDKINLSNNSRKILSQFTDKLPQPLEKLPKSIEDRVFSMQEIEHKLEEAKKYSIHDKILALCKTASVVATLALFIIAAVVLFTVPMTALVALAVTLAAAGAFIAYWFLSAAIGIIERQEIINIEQKLTNYSIPFYWKEGPDNLLTILSSELGGAAVLPLFQAFTRKSRLNRVLDHLKLEVKQSIDSHNQKNEKIFLESKNLYRLESENLINNLKSEINQFKDTLSKEKNETIKKILKEHINTYEKSLSELERIVNFHLLKK